MNTKMPVGQRQSGQAMVEYIVVVGALVGALMAAPNVIDTLQTRMQAKQAGYNYAISLSPPPAPMNKLLLLYAQNNVPPARIKKILDAQKAIDTLGKTVKQGFPPIQVSRNQILNVFK